MIQLPKYQQWFSSWIIPLYSLSLLYICHCISMWPLENHYGVVLQRFLQRNAGAHTHFWVHFWIQVDNKIFGQFEIVSTRTRDYLLIVHSKPIYREFLLSDVNPLWYFLLVNQNTKWFFEPGFILERRKRKNGAFQILAETPRHFYSYL